eukprot:261772_1
MSVRRSHSVSRSPGSTPSHGYSTRYSTKMRRLSDVLEKVESLARMRTPGPDEFPPGPPSPMSAPLRPMRLQLDSEEEKEYEPMYDDEGGGEGSREGIGEGSGGEGRGEGSGGEEFGDQIEGEPPYDEVPDLAEDAAFVHSQGGMVNWVSKRIKRIMRRFSVEDDDDLGEENGEESEFDEENDSEEDLDSAEDDDDYELLRENFQPNESNLSFFLQSGPATARWRWLAGAVLVVFVAVAVAMWMATGSRTDPRVDGQLSVQLSQLWKEMDRLQAHIATVGEGQREMVLRMNASLERKIDSQNDQLSDLQRKIDRSNTSSVSSSENSKSSSDVDSLLREVGDVRALLEKLNLNSKKDAALTVSDAALTSKVDADNEKVRSTLAQVQSKIALLESNIKQKSSSEARTQRDMQRLRTQIKSIEAVVSVMDKCDTSGVRSQVTELMKEIGASQEDEVDYALFYSGGRVLTISQRYFPPPPPNLFVWARALYLRVIEPNDLRQQIIDPDMTPGRCLPLKGATGHADIRLQLRIVPWRVSLGHISARISSNPRTSPRHFAVLGLNSMGKWDLMGEFEYSNSSTPIQKFDLVNPNSESYEEIRLQLRSNYGDPSYTCLYRFAVHGEPVA